MDFASVAGVDDEPTTENPNPQQALADTQQTPVGSKIGEAGERLRSARRRGRPGSATSVSFGGEEQQRNNAMNGEVDADSGVSEGGGVDSEKKEGEDGGGDDDDDDVDVDLGW